MHGDTADGRVTSGFGPCISISEKWGRSVEVRSDISYQDVVAGAMIRFH